MNNCAQCKIDYSRKYCKDTETGVAPKECTTLMHKEELEKAKKEYQEPSILEFAKKAAIQEATCYGHIEGSSATYPTKPRIVEVVEFCHRMGYKKIGLAFCGGLRKEASIVESILEKNGFTVVSAICKVGGVDKSFIGVKEEEKICGGGKEAMCNPIFQAEIMNKEKTEFNILLGLCVGHDSLFLKYSEAMCTVFAVKDRVLGHNPLAAIYTIDTYHNYLK